MMMVMNSFTKKLNSNYLSSKSVTYISVDIECSGPIPGEYSMLSLGACVVGYEDNKNNDYTLYLEIQPLRQLCKGSFRNRKTFNARAQGKRHGTKGSYEEIR